MQFILCGSFFCHNKTLGNLPWALNFPSKFDYTIETVSIDLGRLKFIPWVLSNGTDYIDWYKDLDGYRNEANIPEIK